MAYELLRAMTTLC